MNKLISDYLI